jgi:K+-transporting ATPase A subunit
VARAAVQILIVVLVVLDFLPALALGPWPASWRRRDKSAA